MTTARFPLPMSMFSQETAKACSAALEDSLARLGPEELKILPSEATRFALANGIFIAATLGIAARKDLVKAALGHFAQVTSWSMPLPEPLEKEKGETAASPECYRLRAEELRAAIGEVKSPHCRDALTAVSLDYERMAKTAERIQASLKTIGAGRTSG